MGFTKEMMTDIIGKSVLKALEKEQLDITWNKNAPKPKTENYIVVIGSLGDGFDFVGPFDNEGDARTFAQSKNNKALSGYTPQLYPLLDPKDA